MSSFYFFEIASIIYWAGALILGIYLIKKYRASIFKGIMVPIFLFIGMALLLKIQIEPYELSIRRQTIDTGKLQNSLKVILISDTHLRPLKRGWFLEKAEQKIAAEKPDLIIFAGDFLFYDHIDTFQNDFQVFKKISALAPTYAVLGNHDYGIGNIEHTVTYKDQHERIKKLLENSGVKVLVDENTSFDFKGQTIQLVGFDEFWHWGKHPEKAMQNLLPNGLKIGLSHNPDAAYLPKSQNLDILLAGHTHGGQVRLPFIGVLTGAETTFPKADYGHFIDNFKPKIFNTVGIGESGLPIRFFDHPEIAVLTIN